MGDYEAAAEPEIPPAVAIHRTAQICFWIVSYFLAIWLLGFSYAVPSMMLAYLKFGAAENWRLSLVLTICGWAFYYFLFEYSLNIPFPPGLVFEWFA